MGMLTFLTVTLSLAITVLGTDVSTQEDYDPFNGLLTVHTYPLSADDQGKEHKWIWIQTERLYFKFSLKACHSAHIGMATHHQDATSLHYEVVFGQEMYGIKDLRSGNYLVQKNETFLECENYVDIWISWGNMSIAVGRGDVVGHNELISQQTPDAFNTRSVSFTTGGQQQGWWKFHKDMGRLITVHNIKSAGDPPAFDFLWLSFEEDPSVVFQLKSCSSARISISPTRESPSGSLELLIGHNDNTITNLHDFSSGQVLFSGETPGILSCSEYRYFWLLYRSNYVQFGEGSIIADNTMFSYLTDLNVLNLGFDAIAPAGADWQFRHITGEYYSIFTFHDNRLFDEVLLTTTHSYLEFYVLGCHHAIVALQTSNTTFRENEYMIVIGDNNNQQTTVQQRTPDGYTIWKIVDTPNVLDCDVAKPYWISWKDNTINFGPGFYYWNNSVMQWTPNDETLAPIREIRLGTDETDKAAEWRINIDSVSTLTRRTNGFPSFNQLWYDVTDTTQFVFTLRVCADAFIKLTEYHGTTDYHAYEFQLGILGDTKASLIKDSSVVQSVTMTQQLSCNFATQFWIAWRKEANNATTLSFGNGPYVYEDSLIDYVDTSPYDINAVSIATGELKVGDWTFSAVKDNSLVLETDPVYDYKYGFVALTTYWFQFGIRACSHTCFIVSGNTDYNNVANSRSVEFCLGIEGNTKSHIKDMETGVLSVVDTPNILMCTAYRAVWFTWNNENITVGRGDLYEKPLLHYRGPNPTSVNLRFVRFSTTDLVSALIKVPKESYGMINLETSGNNIVPVMAASKNHQVIPNPHPSSDLLYGRYWMTSVSQLYLLFSVRACQEVYVALSPQYGGTHITEVRIGINNNTLTEISMGDVVRSASSEGVLSCEEKRDFWITWSSEEVAVGTGRIPGDNRIVNHRESSANYIIHAVAFATNKGFVGTWEIPAYDVDSYLAKTSANQVNPVEIHTRQSQFLFTLMIASDAEIILYKSDTDFFRVVLGTDEGSAIKLFKREYEVHAAPNQQYIADGVFQKFWLTWKSNTIKLGLGHKIDKQSILLYVDGGSDVFVKDVAKIFLSSSKCPTHGYWSFPKYAGNATIYHSPQGVGYYGLRMMTRSTTESIFRVKTCNQALIALSDFPGIITERTLEIVIEDGRTALRNSVGGEELVSFPTKGGLLDCEHYRAYWLRWKDYTIELGAGHAVGDNRFLVYYLPDKSYTVNELNMGTGESEGSWEFSPLAGNLYHVHTTLQFEEDKLHTQMWLTSPKTSIEFAVKAAKQARVALSFQPLIYNTTTYEVVFHDNDNMDTVLYYIDNNGNRKENTRVSHGAVLDKNTYRTLWVSWENQMISVGAGQLNSGFLLTMQGSMMFNIHAISFAGGTESGAYADWSFLQGDDDALMVQSREFYNGPDFSMTSTDRKHIVFQVKSCHHAVILLASEFGNEKSHAYEVSIGRDGNTKSSICTQPGGDECVEKDTPEILNCNKYRTFWVAWDGENTRFGMGAFLNVDEVLAYSNALDVVQVFLNTGNQDIGLWQLIDPDGESFTVHTGSSHSYDFVRFLPRYSHVAFKVQACSDAHIALITDNAGEQRVHYEVVIGCCNNMKTVIRNESLTYNVAKIDSPQVLSCNQLRTFWVSWDNGAIQVGIGEVYSHMLLQYMYPESFDVYEVSLSTYESVEGKFKFNEELVSDISLQTRDVGAYSYSQFWRTLLGQNYIVFKVQAPRDVQLLLSAAPNIVETNAYEVKIGTEGNKKTEILKRGTTVVSLHDTDGILSETEMRYFWIERTDTHVRFGTGSSVGENERASLEDSEYTMNCFSITTQSGVTASWKFPQDFEVPPSSTSSGTGPTETNLPTQSSSSSGATSSTTTQKQPDIPGEGLSAGAIVGITFGVIGFLMIVALGVILFIRLRQLKTYEQFTDENDGMGGNSGVTWDNPNYEGAAEIQLQSSDRGDPFRVNTGSSGSSNY